MVLQCHAYNHLLIRSNNQSSFFFFPSSIYFFGRYYSRIFLFPLFIFPLELPVMTLSFLYSDALDLFFIKGEEETKVEICTDSVECATELT